MAAGSKCDTLTPEAGQDAVQSVLTDVQNGVAAMQNASAVMANADAPDAPETPIATPVAAAYADGRDLTRSTATVRLPVG